MIPRNKPSWWAVAYALQIAFFASIYYANAPAFYHSTALFEPNLQREERAIELELEREVFGRAVGREGWEVPQLYVRISYEDRYRQNMEVVGLLAQPIASGTVGIVFYEGRDQISVNLFDLEGAYDDQIGEGGENWKSFYFTPSKQFFDLYRGWRSEHYGLSDRLSGLPIRMLYLSVVTTTTLGYGDIVPLTSWMRFAIALQAIVGVVISAGFINAVLRRREN